MTITLENVSKRYNDEWIFKDICYEFLIDEKYAITGPNGIGKSTLLQIICSNISPSSGKVIYKINSKFIPVEKIIRYLSFAAPYLELIEQFTLEEMLAFHSKFKPFYSSLTINEIIGILGMGKQKDKQIKLFSSGMKQRVKLALAFFSDTAIILLDEPCTNLDKAGVEWYHSLIKEYCKNRLTIICSNHETEYSFCKYVMNLAKVKAAI